ncbi:MotA/TolQ/ExbB proton channel family protein [Roseomonas sp. OT10]|uniref:MotA/TolQ/ExbB proton channel family protein n=1 Tax=Roseomonas cutis TaxID=2897332 RepID=UPI001E5DE06B|nr:MotA/TolQ/ExbB proton channel family protein [Roseomonas sp. OT10]UFN48674.1 MotA/TolQ/ExbB proton channel family protein [Roseomonas sp. OT10]
MNPVPAEAVHDLSMLGLFLQADIVVKSVMILLILASVACWAIMVEKVITLGRLRREIRRFAEAVHAGGTTTGPQGEGLAARVLRAGVREWREGRDHSESRGEYRQRIEHAMRAAVGATLRRAEPGLPVLATTGSVSPFVGLFGTVWGIMNSFTGIAQSNDTSLAVVAPGIAEALFATAIGLAAAIPAVLAYNRFTVALSRLRAEGNAAAGELAAALVKRSPVSGAAAPAAE